MAKKKDDPFGSLDLDTDVPVVPPPPRPAGAAKAPVKPKAAAPAPAAKPAPPPAPAAPPVPPAPPKPEAVPSVGKLGRVAAQKATEVCRHFELGDAAKALLKEELVPGQFLYLLIEKQLYEDAVAFLAHALPKPEAVGWACQGVRALEGGSLPPEVVAALRAAEQWAREPSEANRLATLTPAEALEFSTPAGCAALAAYRSAGFYGPAPPIPAIPPDEYLTAQAVTDCLVSAAEEGAESVAERYRKILALGIQVGNGAGPGK